MLLAAGEGAKVTPQSVTDLASSIANDVHRVQPHALSITNATEYGLVYTPQEVGALGELARSKGWGYHMDGARFGNAATIVSGPSLTGYETELRLPMVKHG